MSLSKLAVDTGKRIPLVLYILIIMNQCKKGGDNGFETVVLRTQCLIVFRGPSDFFFFFNIRVS